MKTNTFKLIEQYALNGVTHPLASKTRYDILSKISQMSNLGFGFLDQDMDDPKLISVAYSAMRFHAKTYFDEKLGDCPTGFNFYPVFEGRNGDYRIRGGRVCQIRQVQSARSSPEVRSIFEECFTLESLPYPARTGQYCYQILQKPDTLAQLMYCNGDWYHNYKSSPSLALVLDCETGGIRLMDVESLNRFSPLEVV